MCKGHYLSEYIVKLKANDSTGCRARTLELYQILARRLNCRAPQRLVNKHPKRLLKSRRSRVVPKLVYVWGAKLRDIQRASSARQPLIFNQMTDRQS